MFGFELIKIDFEEIDSTKLFLQKESEDR